ncbi:MAG: hypothetical protein KC547_20760, partial [Anaerolineae bacterium]|nr:hypothetical protein [Anaerolineae bacterium]
EGDEDDKHQRSEHSVFHGRSTSFVVWPIKDSNKLVGDEKRPHRDTFLHFLTIRAINSTSLDQQGFTPCLFNYRNEEGD